MPIRLAAVNKRWDTKCVMPRLRGGPGAHNSRNIVTPSSYGARMRRFLLLAAATLTIATPAVAQSVDRAVLSRLIDEGINHSQVIVTAQHLSDVIGPRMTNSPAMRRAEEWTQTKLREWGLTGVRKEGFDFGRGWQIEHSSVRMLTPRAIQLTAIPIAWTPGTNGALSAPVIITAMTKERHFDNWRGKLKGKIVLITRPNNGSEPAKPAFQRYTADEIAKLDSFQQPRYDPEAATGRLKRVDFNKKLDAFLKSEGALAWAQQSRLDGKLIHGEGYLFGANDTPSLPGIEIAAEDYRRLARLAKAGTAPMLEIDSKVSFDDSDRNAYNIIAEIAGTDPKAGYSFFDNAANPEKPPTKPPLPTKPVVTDPCAYTDRKD